MWWLVAAKQVVFRVLAACLAFVPAMLFGVAAVNKYYDYYQNWDSAISDMTNSNAGTGVPAAAGGAGGRLSTFHGAAIDRALAAQDGYTLHLTVRGRLSHIKRSVYVYLPPQYFQPSYRSYRFPAIELLHGFPGQPQDWITVVGVTTTLQDLIAGNQARPAVLVMPDANGGRAISLQCLNQAHGPQDATYLAEDLPGFMRGCCGCSRRSGLGNSRYSRAGSRREPGAQVPRPVRRAPSSAGIEHGEQWAPTRLEPLVTSLRAGTPIPQFWLGVGSGDCSDLKNAEVFEQLLQVRQPEVTLKMVRGGGHTMFTWRALMPSLLEWMTPRLAQEAAAQQARQVRAEQQAAQAKQAKQARTAARHRRTPPGRTIPLTGAAQFSSRMRTCSTDRWCSAARSARCRPSSRYRSPFQRTTCGNRSP